MPKILKMPKPSPKTEKGNDLGTRYSAPVSKVTAMAEIILFPNGKNEIPFIPQTNPHTQTWWLRLADDALDGNRKHKNS